MPLPQKLNIEIHGENDTVVFKYREGLMIRPSELTLPFHVMEEAYCGMLQARAMKRAAQNGQKIGVAPPDAIPPLASTRPT